MVEFLISKARLPLEMFYIYLAITMIGFVTWPPFSYHHYYKGGQVTKPIIVVKICYKLLYVIQVVKKIFDK